MKFEEVYRNKTGTSQVGAISKDEIKSKGDPLETKKFEKKSHSAEKNRKGDPLVPSSLGGTLWNKLDVSRVFV